MKIPSLLLLGHWLKGSTSTVQAEGVWLAEKPEEEERNLLHHNIRRIQAELAAEVVFPSPLAGGGFCPSLPAGRNPADSTGATNNGWTLVSNPYNDDDSSAATLPFTFDLYGTSYTNTYINNNGNLSFGSSYSSFTSSGFPVSGRALVAPFWADVDTRPTELNGRVWQQTISTNKFAVAWDHVGYYRQQGDKRNTFMVLISDGTDAEMGLGNNVCFCYEDMEWTTGSASGGVNGFGGTQATVGANEGSGDLGYFQIGRYNEAGSATSAGIDNLDGESYCFDITTGVNVPPIATGVPEGNVVNLECDETLDLSLTFASPEGDDTTIVTYTLDGVSGGVVDGFTIDIQDGIQTALVTIDWVPSDAVTHVLELTAIDSFGGVTNVPLTLTSVGSCSTGSPSKSPTTNPTANPSLSPSKSPSSSPSKSPSTSPSSSPTKADIDKDGVFDDEDECLGTSIDEDVPEIKLKPNHFVLGSDGTFVKGEPKGEGEGTDKSFTIEQTHGCSCEQIIEQLGLGNGHRKFGCSPGVMDCWVNGNCDDDLFDRNLRG